MRKNKTAQHNQLARAPLPPSLHENKIFTLMLACLTADMVESPQAIHISVKEVAGTNDPDSTHYELIKKAFEALFDRAVSILPPNATKGDVDLVRIVSGIMHIKDTDYIESRFATDIVPYLLEFKEQQFHPTGQEPAHVATEREQPPVVLLLELFLQPRPCFNEIQIAGSRES